MLEYCKGDRQKAAAGRLLNIGKSGSKNGDRDFSNRVNKMLYDLKKLVGEEDIKKQ
jgi:hypothetical protein